MKTIFAALAVLFGLVFAIAGAEPGSSTRPRPQLFDLSLNGMEQVTHALKCAKAENKRVLLLFGANWYSWCHRLHGVLTRNAAIAKELNANYVLVLIDVSQIDGRQNNEEVDQYYGRPTRLGIPVLVVLESDGRALTTLDASKLEDGDTYSALKLRTFISKWKPPTIASNP